MTEEQENPVEESGHKPLTDKSVNKALAILFVLLLYIVIFLKILFIS